MSDITFNRYAILGTNAERLAFTPDPTDISSIGPGEFLLVLWVESDTGDIYYWDAVTAVDWVLLVASGGGGITQLTGEVTAGPGSGSQAATIANNAVVTAKILNANVTYAKIQDISATSRVLGRISGGAGVTEELAAADLAAILTGQFGTVTIVSIGFTIDGGGSPIPTGVYTGIVRRFAQTGTIVGWTLSADQSANLELDVFMDDPTGTYPPTTSIVASAPPELVAVDFDDDTTLTGWTTAVTAGDMFGIEVVANDTAERFTLQIDILVA